LRFVWFRYVTPSAPLVQEVVEVIMEVVPRPLSMAQPVTPEPERVGGRGLAMSMAWAISTNPLPYRRRAGPARLLHLQNSLTRSAQKFRAVKPFLAEFL